MTIGSRSSYAWEILRTTCLKILISVSSQVCPPSMSDWEPRDRSLHACLHICQGGCAESIACTLKAGSRGAGSLGWWDSCVCIEDSAVLAWRFVPHSNSHSQTQTDVGTGTWWSWLDMLDARHSSLMRKCVLDQRHVLSAGWLRLNVCKAMLYMQPSAITLKITYHVHAGHETGGWCSNRLGAELL